MRDSIGDMFGCGAKATLLLSRIRAFGPARRVTALSHLGVPTLSAIPGFSELVYSIRSLRRF